MSRSESGITLVALIITIIILVILAAVSITAVTNSRIIDVATNGTANYAQEQRRENETMENSVDFMNEKVESIDRILHPEKYSTNP